MESNQGLLIHIADSANRLGPVANVLVDAIFCVGGRLRYQFSAGITDASGHLDARFEHFEHERELNASRNLMDYNTKLEDCDSQIRLHVPSVVELENRLKAVQKWYPELAESHSARIAISANGRFTTEDALVAPDSGKITRVDMIVRAIR